MSAPAPGVHPASDHEPPFFAPCPRGLEELLAAELTGLGAQPVAPTQGGVAFGGDLSTAWLVNLHSRLASRVLMRVGKGPYRDEDGLYKLARRIEWERWFDAGFTLRVDVAAQRSPLKSLNFAALRIKDGIVDRFRETTGTRPSIDTQTPDVRVHAFLQPRSLAIYLDLSGEPLFKRGWRAEAGAKGEAPLKENLAAGLLMLARWYPGEALIDPFCGSGTLLVEAAQMQLGIAPGIQRGFAFEKLLDHDAAAWSRLKSGAAAREQSLRRGLSGSAEAADPTHPGQAPPGAAARALMLAGSDLDPQAIERTRRNLERAGIDPARVRLRVADCRKARPVFDRPGLVIANPPYGQRIEAHDDVALADSPNKGRDVRTGRRLADQPIRLAPRSQSQDSSPHDQVLAAFGDALRQQFGGWRVALMSSDERLPAIIGLKPKRRTPLYNGALECRLFQFEIFAAPPPQITPAP